MEEGIKEVPIEDLEKEEIREEVPPQRPIELDGKKFARGVGNFFAIGLDTTARKEFLDTYQEVVGPILDLVNFQEALGAASIERMPRVIRIGIGVTAIGATGIILRRTYEKPKVGEPSRDRGVREELGVREARPVIIEPIRYPHEVPRPEHIEAPPSIAEGNRDTEVPKTAQAENQS